MDEWRWPVFVTMEEFKWDDVLNNINCRYRPGTCSEQEQEQEKTSKHPTLLLDVHVSLSVLDKRLVLGIRQLTDCIHVYITGT